MHLGTRKNVGHCHVCNETWDGIALVRELKGFDFKDAVKWLTASIKVQWNPPRLPL